MLLITALASHAELWTPVGQVQWTDGILGCQDSRWNTSWTVSVERSNSRSGVFRLQPYANFRPSTSPEYKYNNVYVYLHVEDTEKCILNTIAFIIAVIATLEVIMCIKGVWKMVLIANIMERSPIIRQWNFQ